jgi:methyl-accepting chemotaxis protein PixJ
MVDQLNAAKNSPDSTAESPLPIAPSDSIVALPESSLAAAPTPAPLQAKKSSPFDRFKRLSLKTKATALAIALGTLPVIGIGAIAYYFANQSITEQIRDTEEAIAGTLSQRITAFMAERNGDVQVMSGLPILTNSIVRDQIAPEDKKAVLERVVESYGVYDSVAVFDLSGNVTLQSGQQQIPVQINQDYFKAALESNKVQISRPVRADLTGPYVIYITAPVRDTVSGQKISIFRAVMPVKSLTEQLKEYKKNEVEFSVVDASNQIFVSSQEDHVGQIATSIYSNFTDMQALRKINSRVITDTEADGKREMFASYAPWTPCVCTSAEFVGHL